MEFAELDTWLAYFRSRKDRVAALPQTGEGPLEISTRDLIAKSIATFQLGESSEGTRLKAASVRFGEAEGLPAVGEVTELFIKEEQFHAGLLASFMRPNSIPFLKKQWSDNVFRMLRQGSGLEREVTVLVVAELIALSYYKALAAATPSPALKEICRIILNDEEAHVAYQATLIGHLRARHRMVTRALIRATHAFLHAGAIIVVYRGHRGVLNAGGFSFGSFWRACRTDFRRCFGRQFKPALAPVGF